MTTSHRQTLKSRTSCKRETAALPGSQPVVQYPDRRPKRQKTSDGDRDGAAKSTRRAPRPPQAGVLQVERLSASYLLNLRYQSIGDDLADNSEIKAELEQLANWPQFLRHPLESADHFASRRLVWLEHENTPQPVLCCLPGALPTLLERAEQLGYQIERIRESEHGVPKPIEIPELQQFPARQGQYLQFLAHHREGVLRVGKSPKSVCRLLEHLSEVFSEWRLAVVVGSKAAAQAIWQKLQETSLAAQMQLCLGSSCLQEPPGWAIVTADSLGTITPGSIDLLLIADPNLVVRKNFFSQVLLETKRARRFLLTDLELPQESLTAALIGGYFGGNVFDDNGEENASREISVLPFEFRLGRASVTPNPTLPELLRATIWKNSRRNQLLVDLLLDLPQRLARFSNLPDWCREQQGSRKHPPVIVLAGHQEHAEILNRELESRLGPPTAYQSQLWCCRPCPIRIVSAWSEELPGLLRRFRRSILVVAGGTPALPEA
ncbi:MAG: hypothetical protein KDA68_02185, partial [Planctomycetaceae bacterium]|nr:hypothetical protein [Planctomycetaceae bacterium]